MVVACGCGCGDHTDFYVQERDGIQSGGLRILHSQGLDC